MITELSVLVIALEMQARVSRLLNRLNSCSFLMVLAF